MSKKKLTFDNILKKFDNILKKLQSNKTITLNNLRYAHDLISKLEDKEYAGIEPGKDLIKKIGQLLKIKISDIGDVWMKKRYYQGIRNFYLTHIAKEIKLNSTNNQNLDIAIIENFCDILKDKKNLEYSDTECIYSDDNKLIKEILPLINKERNKKNNTNKDDWDSLYCEIYAYGKQVRGLSDKELNPNTNQNNRKKDLGNRMVRKYRCKSQDNDIYVRKNHHRNNNNNNNSNDKFYKRDNEQQQDGKMPIDNNLQTIDKIKQNHKRHLVREKQYKDYNQNIDEKNNNDNQNIKNNNNNNISYKKSRYSNRKAQQEKKDIKYNKSEPCPTSMLVNLTDNISHQTNNYQNYDICYSVNVNNNNYNYSYYPAYQPQQYTVQQIHPQILQQQMLLQPVSQNNYYNINHNNNSNNNNNNNFNQGSTNLNDNANANQQASNQQASNQQVQNQQIPNPLLESQKILFKLQQMSNSLANQGNSLGGGK